MEQATRNTVSCGQGSRKINDEGNYLVICSMTDLLNIVGLISVLQMQTGRRIHMAIHWQTDKHDKTERQPDLTNTDVSFSGDFTGTQVYIL